MNWGNSTCRTWLNTVFFADAFNTREQVAILTSTIMPNGDSQVTTGKGDKVILLGLSEAKKYFSNNA